MAWAVSLILVHLCTLSCVGKRDWITGPLDEGYVFQSGGGNQTECVVLLMRVISSNLVGETRLSAWFFWWGWFLPVWLGKPDRVHSSVDEGYVFQSGWGNQIEYVVLLMRVWPGKPDCLVLWMRVQSGQPDWTCSSLDEGDVFQCG